MIGVGLEVWYFTFLYLLLGDQEFFIKLDQTTFFFWISQSRSSRWTFGLKLGQSGTYMHNGSEASPFAGRKTFSPVQSLFWIRTSSAVSVFISGFTLTDLLVSAAKINHFPLDNATTMPDCLNETIQFLVEWKCLTLAYMTDLIRLEEMGFLLENSLPTK